MATTPAAPARGIRLPRDQRRLQLLAAAREVFVARGYHATAMDEIAERAAVSKPVLYQHFPSKLDLYVALVDVGTDELLGRIHRALASTDDNKQRVSATMTAYFDFVDDRSGFYRLLFESDLTNEPTVKARLENLTELCSREIAAIIADDTGLPPAESRMLAVGLVGLAETAARYWLNAESSIPRPTAADLVTALGWRGIRGFPKREH